MIFKTGRHAGQSAEYVLLRYADDAAYIMSNYPDGPVGKEYARLAKRFDAKPFTAKCYGCSNPATRASAYRTTPSLYFWCDDCDPYDAGAVPGRLVEVRTFTQAIRNVGAHKGDQRDIIKSLAEAKGCPARLTQAAAVKFFL